MKPFIVPFTTAEKDFIIFWMTSLLRGYSNLEGSAFSTHWISTFNFPLSPKFFKKLLKKYENSLFWRMRESSWRLKISVDIPYSRYLDSEQYNKVWVEVAPLLNNHAKEYLNWKYQKELEEGHKIFLAKIAQCPASKKGAEVLSKYLSKDSESDYCYTTPEAMNLVVQESCWFCNPINILMRTEVHNPLQICYDDLKVLQSVSREEKHILLNLINNPLVKQWKKIGAETPLFNIETLEALKFLKENPMVPLAFIEGIGQNFCRYLRFNDSLNRFESIHDGLMNWRPREFSAYFLTTTFRSCSEGELRKYFEGYQGPDPEADCFC